MTIPNKRFYKLKWVQKYSIKPILSKGTLAYYKWAQKIGRREFLKRSHRKTIKFNRKNPGSIHWRVFKCKILKNKNVSINKLNELKAVIIKNKSVKNLRKTV